MKVSVIIPTIKGRETSLAVLKSSIPKEYEVIVVTGEKSLLAEKRNYGASKAKGEYLFFCDDDNRLEHGAIEAALDLIENNNECGIVGFMGCYLHRPSTVWDGGSMRDNLTGFSFGVNTNRPWVAIDKRAYEVDEVANAFMIHRFTFEAVGKMDEKRFPIELDEADLCRKVRAQGLKVLMCPTARCYHSSQTYSHIPNFRRKLSAYFMGRNRILYQRKFSGVVDYFLYLLLYLPVFVLFYVGSLLYKKNPVMIAPFLKGVCDGLLGRLKNQYQS